jgi:hypothetical protein
MPNRIAQSSRTNYDRSVDASDCHEYYITVLAGLRLDSLRDVQSA